MHVDLLAVTPVSIQDSCDDHELVLCDKVTDAPLVLRSVVRRDGVEVEFQGGGEWRNDSDQQCEEAQYPVHSGLCALRRVCEITGGVDTESPARVSILTGVVSLAQSGKVFGTLDAAALSSAPPSRLRLTIESLYTEL